MSQMSAQSIESALTNLGDLAVDLQVMAIHGQRVGRRGPLLT